MGNTGSTSEEISGLTKGLHEEYRDVRRQGKPEDVHDRCRMNYERDGRYLFPESLLPNDYYANSLRLDRQLTNGAAGLHVPVLPGQPHYSMMKYPVDIRDERTGLSAHLGTRVYRCGDRIQDYIRSLGALAPLTPGPGLMWRCLRSETGEEPTDPYTYMSRHDAEFFADRMQRGNMRAYFFESYPFDKPLDPVPAKGDPPELPRVPVEPLTPEEIAAAQARYRAAYPDTKL
eukprot:TRINITY_DN3062_c0_g2_i1.p1 TRINITY_DN3062_c0_g2~~TRINITY_DN3062_c0_g2_i1.p1  ORF type:complete len:231 (+),score=46.37 TRINITY_DN3062_c0_g2_i1:79-771(+)